MRLLSYFILAFSLLCHTASYAQLDLTPLSRNPNSTFRTHSSSRTKLASPRELPFWDDFSFADSSFAQDSLWLSGKSVWVNNGIGINPPSIGVATFDGLDSLGKPYNINDILIKGFADHLASQPLRMDLIDPSLRATVFLSFHYQFQGNGEPPDPGDSLFLQFRNKDKLWETVWSRNNDGTLDKTVFTEVTVPVTADRFYYEGFQFRFRNYARLSGPYDTWNLDYVFVSNGNVSNDPPAFPDRSLVYPLTSLFSDYNAMPIKHFFIAPDINLVKPSFVITNRRKDQTALEGGQPVNYVSDAIITTNKNGIQTKESINLNNNNNSEGVAVVFNTNKQIILNAIPTTDKFDSGADSISIKIKLKLTSDDNVIKVTVPKPAGDYVPLFYSPIDFRVNDSTSSVFTLSNYYAYDDGTAEFGASLKGYGAQLMYRFDMKTTKPDTLVGVYLYFPRFGDESSQIIQLQVLKNLAGTPTSQTYQVSMTLTRSQQDKFIYRKFDRFVPVDSIFYLGWKQTSSANIVIGLDKNTDSGGKIYYNTNGAWEQNTLTTGSLMIRPVFGKGGVVVGLPGEEKTSMAYPNPNNGTFFLPIEAKNIQLIDMTGKVLNLLIESTGNHIQIDVPQATTGIYIVRFALNDKVVTQKIIVKR